MIRSDKHRQATRRELTNLKYMRKQSIRLARELGVSDTSFLAALEEEIAGKELLLRDYAQPTDLSTFALLERLAQIDQLLIGARQWLGWSQTEFASRCDLKKQQIHRWEKTRFRTINLNTAIRLANILHEALIERSNASERGR